MYVHFLFTFRRRFYNEILNTDVVHINYFMNYIDETVHMLQASEPDETPRGNK